jgi:hypothetical protein
MAMLPDNRDLTPIGQCCLCNTALDGLFLRGGQMTAIMPIDEPRSRGTVFGERADRRRVSGVEHYFRCNICDGFIDARDLAWVEDNGGPLLCALPVITTFATDADHFHKFRPMP